VTREVSLEDVIFRRCSSHHNHCNNDTDGFGISHSCEVRNVRFEYCESSFNGHDGFDFGGKTPGGIRVEGCLAHHNGMQNFGSNFKCQNPGMILINCVAWATGQAADPNFEVAAEDIRLIHCTSGRNEDAGVVVSRKNAEVFNCIIANAKGVALRVEQSASELRVENTIVHECAKPGGVSLGEHGNRQADPAFIDAPAGNFRIAAGSAAAGQGKAQNEASTDADGRPRPKSPSIGAYEPGD
jgi:hypothetical protein